MGSVTQYRCDKCGMEFPSLVELDDHKISKHTNPKQL
jgi:DNA-directed RNA polymerase subunit RPC12/RpoP